MHQGNFELQGDGRRNESYDGNRSNNRVRRGSGHFEKGHLENQKDVNGMFQD